MRYRVLEARLTLSAAFKLEAAESIARIEQHASWLEREWRSAAARQRSTAP